MATEELIKRSLASGRTYDSLPDKLKAALPLHDWNQKVKEQCIHQGLIWQNSLARTACSESQYHEELVDFYKRHLRVFPYHLSDFVCRHMRITPFKYYSEVLFSVMREEKSYDYIPNFTAADILRLLGIGRNEYIALMNKGKAKKLMWRVNKSSILREMLPTEPIDIQFQPWWIVCIVNLGEQEFKSLSPKETELCQKACQDELLSVRQADYSVLQSLYKQGFVYLNVPVESNNYVSIPPLELVFYVLDSQYGSFFVKGFVSNKDKEKNEEKGDPMESLLYSVFVACSERTSVSQLAEILSCETPKLQAAVSFACRLGFAICLPPSIEETLSNSLEQDSKADLHAEKDKNLSGNRTPKSGRPSMEGEQIRGNGIALVVDTEITSYLMMGALSPGLKRHSVSLFEGGRITGTNVIKELIQELHGSAIAAAEFEGEMKMVAGYARSLAYTLEFLYSASQGRTLEILRKETLANLNPGAMMRVLTHGYSALLPITPLPLPPLPLSPSQPGPVDLGSTQIGSTPWLQLAFYHRANSSPHTFVLMHGQIFQSLPEEFQNCSHVLVWPWDPDSVRAQSVPVILEAKFLLHSLNEHLSRTALVAQPFNFENANSGSLCIAYVPLPLNLEGKKGHLNGYNSSDGEEIALEILDGVYEAIQAFSMQSTIGCISFLKISESQEPKNKVEIGESEHRTKWIVYQLNLGMPLRPDSLCQAVCENAKARNVLSPENLSKTKEQQVSMEAQLQSSLQKEFCLASDSESENESLFRSLPTKNFHLHGSRIAQIDLAHSLQGTLE